MMLYWVQCCSYWMLWTQSLRSTSQRCTWRSPWSSRWWQRLWLLLALPIGQPSLQPLKRENLGWNPRKSFHLQIIFPDNTSASAVHFHHFLHSTPSVHSPETESIFLSTKSPFNTWTFSRRDTSSRFPPYIPVPGRDTSATFTGSWKEKKLTSGPAKQNKNNHWLLHPTGSYKFTWRFNLESWRSPIWEQKRNYTRFNDNIKPSQICRGGWSPCPRPLWGCRCRCARSPSRTRTLNKRLILCHLKEWNHQIEDQPNVDHLYVRCLRQVFRDGDEHRGKHQHHRQVDGDNGLKFQLIKLQNRLILIYM